MAKDPRLLNIYLKIHNKRSLTMDDLQYLALYSPECFEKTCKNVVYNFPNAKPIMEPEPTVQDVPADASTSLALPAIRMEDYALTEQQKIDKVLDNLKLLESDEIPQTNVNARDVKDLLGNLFMELLFPHNDMPGYLDMPTLEPASSVDFKV